MRQIEQARAYEELTHHIRTANSISPSLSPHAIPFIPCRNGPAEMPILSGEEDPTQRQVASRSPKSRHSKKCSKCGSRKHRSKQCLLGLALITSTLGQERMMLTECLALMDKPDWAPALCKSALGTTRGIWSWTAPSTSSARGATIMVAMVLFVATPVVFKWKKMKIWTMT